MTSSWPRFVPFLCNLILRDASHFRRRMDRSNSADYTYRWSAGIQGDRLRVCTAAQACVSVRLACSSNLSSSKYVISYIPSGTWKSSQRHPSANMRRGFWRNCIYIYSLSTCRDLLNLNLFLPCKPHRVPSDPSDYRPWYLAYHWHYFAALDSIQFDPASGLSCGLSWAWCRVSTCRTFVSSRQCDGDSMWRIEALTQHRSGSVGLSEWVLSALGSGLVDQSPQLGCQIGVCPSRATCSVSPVCVLVGVAMVRFCASTGQRGWHHV